MEYNDYIELQKAIAENDLDKIVELSRKAKLEIQQNMVNTIKPLSK